MATTPTLLSIEEYLQTSYSPDVHFVDGEIEERNLGEHTHNFIQGLIYNHFLVNGDAWGVEGIIEQRVRISSSRVRVADVAVISLDGPFEEVMSDPPLICIEIFSQQDRLSRAEVVLADYFAIGVQNIWLIDPLKRTVATYSGNKLIPSKIAELSVPGTEIELNLSRIFSALDAKLAAGKRL